MFDAAQDLIAFGLRAADASLLASTCGNVSLRIDDERFMVSATGCTLGGMSEQDIAVISLADGTLIEGAQPSVETELHRRVFVERADVGAILHCQSFAATLLCCHPDPPRNLDLIPEIPALVGAHAYVPFSIPGGAELADSVAEAFLDETVSVVQMRNHGQVVVGSTWRDVLRRALFFELACKLATHGSPVEPIPEDLAAQLRAAARRC